VPPSALPWCNAASLWSVGALSVLLLVILIEGFRRDRTEALLAVVPILLAEFSCFGLYLVTTFHISSEFYPFGLGISLGDIAALLMVLVIAALTLRRFVRTQVRQEVERKAIAQDLEQAQQLQQRVLVPEALASRFFTVETEYRPAQTVGGDFFQTLTKPDGSLLVVIGDVSGKGVSAAMLVAVLVGAIRNQAEYSFDPVAMLTMLNRRLLGRSGGHFATCLAVEILPDGTMRLANAGHLPPYRNGEEMELEGSLPLGLVSEATSSAQTFTLEPGDHITFLTDGVVEAINPANELFGFARAQQISGQPAASIAQQAQVFGQNDDITVLGVEFTGASLEAQTLETETKEAQTKKRWHAEPVASADLV
jgi:serine phosphatase RsbU (regulator of sigma subunit)